MNQNKERMTVRDCTSASNIVTTVQSIEILKIKEDKKI